MKEWVNQLVEGYGYLGVAGLTLLENLFPPIPSEVVLPLGGFLTTHGDMTYWGVVLAGTAGSVGGAIPLYYLGHWVSNSRLKTWVESHGHWLLLRPGEIERAEAWFGRHGQPAVFFGRLVPGVRSLISIPAGYCRMPLGRFLLWTAAGTAIWTALLAWAGRALGEEWPKLGDYMGPVSLAIVAGGVVVYLVWALKRRRDHMNSKAEAAERASE